MPNNCCKNVTKFVQLKENLVTPQAVHIPVSITLDACLFFIYTNVFLTEISYTSAIAFPEKPPLITVPLTLLYSVFLI